MSERKDERDWSERRPGEGVRIIRADEAQAALEAGEAAGRRPDDELRFGDVPPAPTGPRPQHRFPLPDSIDPASAVPRPPVAVPLDAEERERGRRISPPGSRWSREPEQAERTWAELPEEPPPARRPEPAAERRSEWEPRSAEAEWDLGDRTTELEFPQEHPRIQESSAGEPGGAPGRPATPPAYREPEPAYREPEEGLTVTGGTELPHWSDPPTGEVPRIFISDDDEAGEEDDLAAWQALGSRASRWRDDAGDWEDVGELSELVDDVEPTGILDQSRSEHSDLYSFDEDFERAAPSARA